MMNYKKAKQMAVPSQNVEIDPRSKTQSVQVKGQRAMLDEKKSKADWY